MPRKETKRLIQKGTVLEDSVIQDSPAHPATDTSSIELMKADNDVGRGAVKLRTALDTRVNSVGGVNAAG